MYMGADDRLSIMEVPLSNNLLEQWLGVTIRGTRQAASKDSRWAYEPVFDLCPDVEPDIKYIDDGSSDKVSKDQENMDDQGREEVV